MIVHCWFTGCRLTVMTPPEPWAKKCDVHDQPEHSTHAQNCAAEKTYWNKFLTLWPFSQGTNLLILALESTYELLYMHQLPCFQISAPSPEPAAHMMQTPPHSRTQLSKRMAARGKRTLITPPHRRAAPWCALELGAKNRTGKLKINYSGTGMEGGSWLSGGHWGQRREKREDAEQAGKEGRVQRGKGKHRGVGSNTFITHCTRRCVLEHGWCHYFEACTGETAGLIN